LPEADDIQTVAEPKAKKLPVNFLGLLIAAVIAAIVSGAVTFVLVRFVFGDERPGI